MYPVSYSRQQIDGYVTSGSSSEQNWYKWHLTLRNNQQVKGYLAHSHYLKAGLNKCAFTWDYDRKMLTIAFSECHLTNEQLNKDVKAAVLGSNGERFFEKRRNYLIESDDDCSKKLIFIFELKVNYSNIIKDDARFYDFACYIPACDKEEKGDDHLLSPALDLSNLLESRQFSDVTIVTSNDNGERHEFSAHWLILTARSDVFQKMFETDMKEKTEGRIEIKEFKTYVMKQVLAYIYSGKINEVAVAIVASDILRAADYYNLDPLRQIIGQILEEKLAGDNAFEYLVLGDMYKVPKLKKAAIKFIVTKIDNMTDNPGFKIISDSHMHLMKDLLVALAKK